MGQTGEFEEQNAVMGKHIDSMKSAISKLEVETVQQRQNNAALQHQLDQLRQMVVTHFKGLQIPGLEEPVSLQTADQFVSLLHSSLDHSSPPLYPPPPSPFSPLPASSSLLPA